MGRLIWSVFTAAALSFGTCAVADAEPPTDVSGGQTYTIAAASVDGRSSDGRGDWQAGFLTLTGGDPRVAEVFNSASAASVNGQLTSATDGAAGGTTPWHFESKGEVTFRPIAVAQLITGSLGYGAHPTAYVGTIVIDSRTATPITLADLFGDDRAGLARLSDESRRLLARDGFETTDGTGLEPVAANFANWIPTPNGLEIHFNEYQLGSRFGPTVLVPWSALSDVLAPSMTDLTT